MKTSTPTFALAALLCATAFAQAEEAPVAADAPTPSIQIAPDPHAPQVGSGPYRYQFVLRDTLGDAPAGLHPFALSHTDFDLPFVREEKDVYQGITDAQGRTPVFAFESAPPATGWVLLERFGSGPYGERMRLRGGGDDDTGIAGMPYQIVVCGRTPRLYRGVSNRQGETAYVAASEVVTMMLYVDAGGDMEATGAQDPIQAGDGQTAMQRCRDDQGSTE